MGSATCPRTIWGVLFACLALCARANADLVLDFHSSAPGTIQDWNSLGTGLTGRLPATGGDLPSNDPHLQLDTSAGVLQISSTPSDLNYQVNLGTGEYLGTRLSDLGFTGGEDFSVSAGFLNVADSENYDQYGLFVGTASDTSFRAGTLFIDEPYLFSVQGQGDTDHQLVTDPLLSPQPGDH